MPYNSFIFRDLDSAEQNPVKENLGGTIAKTICNILFWLSNYDPDIQLNQCTFIVVRQCFDLRVMQTVL
jgi:hypothetical protein